MPQLTPEEIERLAHKRARAKMGWYVHAAVYVLVNLFIFGVAYFGLRARPWNIYPALGWGLGLLLHGVSVFMLSSGSSLSDSMVQRERERIQRQQDGRP
jgi:hypothetical protein